jgi:hypothetical protein
LAKEVYGNKKEQSYEDSLLLHFFRFGLADFFADFELGGGGVASIFFKPASKLNPFADNDNDL